MKSNFRKYLPNFSINLEAGEYIENFLVSSVFSVFAIRVFLSLTDYPQIGGAGLHIAHMLWGGLLMLVSIITLLMFLSRDLKYLSSIVGGLGFGIFMDELGKFITSDNNYFFQPTIALIYLTFIFLYFIVRTIRRLIPVSDEDYLINALEFLKETVQKDLDIEEQKRALFYLDKCNPKNPFVKHLKKTISSVKANKRRGNIFSKIKYSVHKIYLSVLKSKISNRIIVSTFIFFSLINIFVTLANIKLLVNTLSFWDWGQLLSALSVGIMVLYGIHKLHKKKWLESFKILKFAVMIDIFFGQFFLFYREGLSSYLRLLISITVFFTLQYAIAQEKLKS